MKLARSADKLLRNSSIDMPPNLSGRGKESNRASEPMICRLPTWPR